ncbi:hypothetical protein EDD18DRAFT_451556 [Armillaria luteobubalina]|uniref:Uncharacterized protein n=1 Tax=Armillaria luteobubalina TaxID=153913 RepID=A0AA39PYY8_9AGAR|nr:hypothetical protein EDD18DRAFT_451556 [Armillaria luteobubalina]
MAVVTLIANDGKIYFMIFSYIESGQYLLHHDSLIALTRREYIRFEITGGGNSTSPSTVSFPGAYAVLPSIRRSSYQTLNGITIPGQCSALYGSLSP